MACTYPGGKYKRQTGNSRHSEPEVINKGGYFSLPESADRQ